MNEGERFDLRLKLGHAEFEAGGNAQNVMTALEEFKVLIAESAALAPASSDSEPAEASSSPAGEPELPLPVFVKRDWPSQAAKATAIVMWATRNDGKDGLRPSDVGSYWRKTQGKVPANSSQVCANAATQGWLHNTGSGVYAITGHGEAMVDATKLAS